MKVCPNCHTPARFEGQKFCAVCGHRFAESDPEQIPAVSKLETPSSAAPPSVMEPTPAAPAEEPAALEAPRPVERRRPASAPAEQAEETAPEAPRPVERRRPAPAPAEPTEEPAPEASRPAERRRPALAPAEPAEEPAPEMPRPVERRRPAPAPAKPAEEPAPEIPRPVEKAVPETPEAAPAAEKDDRPMPPPLPETPQPAPAAPHTPAGFAGIPPENPVPPQMQRGSNRKGLVVAGVILALVIVAALVFVGMSVLRGSGENAEDTGMEVSSTAEETAGEATPLPQSGTDSGSAALPTATATPQPVATPAPTPVTPAVANDTQVVLRNAAQGGTITVNGVPVEFTYVGNDAVIPRSELPDVCQVRIVAPAGDGTYQTAALWYNQVYGNDLVFGADYGAYVPCDETGLAKPSDKMVDVLTWAFYRGFLNTINTMDQNSMEYSTAANTQRCIQEISGYFAYSYDLSNFTAVCDPTSIQYNETDGTVVYNGHFISYHADRGTNENPENADVYRTLRLVWEDGIWKVDAFMRLDDDSFNAGQYAALP